MIIFTSLSSLCKLKGYVLSSLSFVKKKLLENFIILRFIVPLLSADKNVLFTFTQKIFRNIRFTLAIFVCSNESVLFVSCLSVILAITSVDLNEKFYSDKILQCLALVNVAALRHPHLLN